MSNSFHAASFHSLWHQQTSCSSQKVKEVLAGLSLTLGPSTKPWKSPLILSPLKSSPPPTVIEGAAPRACMNRRWIRGELITKRRPPSHSLIDFNHLVASCIELTTVICDAGWVMSSSIERIALYIYSLVLFLRTWYLTIGKQEMWLLWLEYSWKSVEIIIPTLTDFPIFPQQI